MSTVYSGCLIVGGPGGWRQKNKKSPFIVFYSLVVVCSLNLKVFLFLLPWSQDWGKKKISSCLSDELEVEFCDGNDERA